LRDKSDSAETMIVRGAVGQPHQPHERIKDIMIQLVGPGGAGKTTAGLALAKRLRIAFVDLDEQFTARVHDISAYLTAYGYQAYAAQNIQLYLDTRESLQEEAVIALSSGFMTYRDDAHPAYKGLHREILASPTTAVLLPSFDYEASVTETVRRQLRRPFARSVEREEQVIRARFEVYWGLPAKKFETKKPVDDVVDDLVAQLLPHVGLQPSAASAMMSRRD
jgi:shikimate kinase